MSILCAGSIVLDTIVRPVADLQWGTTTFLDGMTRHLGGNGANTSFALARLGCNVRLLGAVGNDDAGTFVEHLLRGGGVDISRLAHSPLPNAATIVLVHTDGRRQFLHRKGASEDAFRNGIVFNADKVGDATHFHLASLFVLPALRQNAPAILQAAKAAGLSTSLDTNWDPHGEWLRVLAPCLPFTDVLFLNEDESRMLTGTDDPVAAAALLHGHGAHTVVQKRGSEGSIVCVRNAEPVHAPGFRVHAVDSTGAGDCFAAGFLRAWINGRSAVVAAHAGNAAGAFSVQRVGAVDGLPGPDEFNAWLARQTAP